MNTKRAVAGVAILLTIIVGAAAIVQYRHASAAARQARVRSEAFILRDAADRAAADAAKSKPARPTSR